MSLPVRNAIAYVVSDRDDPAAARAIADLERDGQPVHVISLRHEPRFSAASAFSALRNPSPHSVRTIHLAQTLRARGIAEVRAGDSRSAKTAAAIASLIPQRPASDFAMLDLDWSRLGATALGVRWMSTRLDNAVAEVVLYGGGGARDVIVKRSFAAERARHEATTLALLERVGAPRVLLFDEERSTIVMERASGISLDRIFASRDVPRLLAAVERAGAWLSAMQEHTRSGSGARELLATIVDGAARDADVFRGRDRARIIERLRTLQRTVAALPLSVAGHHGDYWPGNIFIDGARATVIDFEGYREGLPLEDAAYFLIRADLLARRFRVRADGISGAFFRGYGATPDANAQRLFTMTKALRTLANNTGGNLPLPQRLWTRHTVRKAVLRCLH